MVEMNPPAPPATTAEERFRSFVRLEPSEPAKTPMIMRGTLHPMRYLEGQEGTQRRFYERSLPGIFRHSFAAVEGLEPYAVTYAAQLPERFRSPAWKRLLDWQARYPTLDLEQKVAVLVLSNKLCLNHDVEKMLAGDGPMLKGSRWSDAQAYYAHQRARNPFMVREGQVKHAPEVFIEVFDKAPASSRIKFIASNKFIVYSFEHKKVTKETYRARAVNRRTLNGLRGKVSPCEAKVWESKFWRCDTYFPDYEKDQKELDRQLVLLIETAREAVRLSALEKDRDPFLPHFAEENLHAASATSGIIRMHHKRFADALPHFLRMIEIDPLGAWQRVAVGRMLFELGRFDEALPQFKLGYELAAVARNYACDWLSSCCEKLGRAQEAREWKELAAKISAAINAARRTS